LLARRYAFPVYPINPGFFDNPNQLKSVFPALEIYPPRYTLLAHQHYLLI